MTASRRPSYATVQMLRGFAASAVVLFHLLPFEHKYLPGSPIVPEFLVAGQAGVDVFFVISGFIVTTVSTGHSGRLRDSLSFLVRRCWRIYPTYWVYFGVLLTIYLAAPQLMNQGAAGAPSLLASFLLLPSHSPQLLLVAWTLSFELYFYLVFAFLLYAIDRPRLAHVLLAWTVLVVAGRCLLGGSGGNPLLDLVFNPLNLEFIAGCAIALWAPHIHRAFGITLLLSSLLLGAVLLWLTGTAAPFENIWLRVGIFGTVAAFIVAGCAGWEIPGRMIVPKPLVRLGDASYSLYLSHLLTIGAMGLFWHRLLATMGGTGLAVHCIALLTTFGASLCVGWLSYRLIESPLAGMIRHRGLVPVRTKSEGEAVAV